MATTLNESFPLGTSVAQVLDRLADPDFVADRTAANSTLRGDVVSHTVEGDAIVIRTTATVPVDWLPAVVGSKVSSLPTVEREETWSRSSASGTMRFEISGVPAHASGSMRLQPEGSGSVLTYRIDLGVNMPFVGGVVEKAVAAQIRRSLQAEAALYGA